MPHAHPFFSSLISGMRFWLTIILSQAFQKVLSFDWIELCFGDSNVFFLSQGSRLRPNSIKSS
jgi:hypothetical protein